MGGGGGGREGWRKSNKASSLRCARSRRFLRCYSTPLYEAGNFQTATREDGVKEKERERSARHSRKKKRKRSEMGVRYGNDLSPFYIQTYVCVCVCICVMSGERKSRLWRAQKSAAGNILTLRANPLMTIPQAFLPHRLFCPSLLSAAAAASVLQA